MDEQSILTMRFLGYEKVDAHIKNDMRWLYPIIIKQKDVAILESWNSYKKYLLKSFEDVKRKTIQLYEQHGLTLHPIRHLSLGEYVEIQKTLAKPVRREGAYQKTNDALSIYRKKVEKTREISPFDLPVNTTKDWHMIGETEKLLAVIPVGFVPKDIGRVIPFLWIDMHYRFSLASVAIYGHEIAHTQAESVPGYTKNLVNREVLSIFIEKVFATDLDPSGKLLETVERGRMLSDAISFYEMHLGKNISDSSFKSYQQANDAAHFLGDLLGTKLFDMYQNEPNEKKKQYFKDIQAIFDGKMDVESMLDARKVTINNALDKTMLLRHIPS